MARTGYETVRVVIGGIWKTSRGRGRCGCYRMCLLPKERKLPSEAIYYRFLLLFQLHM